MLAKQQWIEKNYRGLLQNNWLKEIWLIPACLR
jgi:hypothetical protein